MQPQHYDLIAIGAGSGGLAVAEKGVAIHPTSAEELVTMKSPEPPPVDDESIDSGIAWREAS